MLFNIRLYTNLELISETRDLEILSNLLAMHFMIGLEILKAVKGNNCVAMHFLSNILIASHVFALLRKDRKRTSITSNSCTPPSRGSARIAELVG